jgi:hypothetical protein
MYTAALSFNAKDSGVYLKRSDSFFAKNDYQNAIADITAEYQQCKARL